MKRNSMAWSRLAALLALVGLALLVLQPVCDAFALHAGAPQANAAAALQHESGSEATCCTELKAAGLAVNNEFIGDAGKPHVLPVALLLLGFIARLSRLPSQAAASAPPTPRLSYYARTARILR